MTRQRSRQSSLPWPMLALAGVSVAFFALPFAGLIWRAPWSKVTDILS